MRRRSRQAMFVPLVGLILFGCTIATAEAQQSSLPANWQQLSPTDFATLVQGYFQQGTYQSLSSGDQASLATQGALLFSQVNISNTSLSYQTLDTLDHVGQTQLDQWALAAAKSAIAARQDDWTGKPYVEMRAKVMLMRRLQVPDPLSVTQARNWVLAGGTADQVPQTDLVYDFVRQMFADFKVINGPFSVTWVGQINVPQNGDYTFFISPIDVNMGYSNPPASVSMTVSLGGQPVINARPPAGPNPVSLLANQSAFVPTSNWVAQSNAVTLTAGTPVNVQVLVSVGAPWTLPSGVLHAMLSWQGPGIAMSSVPASAFSQAQTGAPGLQATYTWTVNGQQQTLTRTDPMIDFSWTNSSIILPQDPTSANQSADAMWQAMTSSDFVASYATATPVKLHPFFREPEEVSCGLSTARRRAFLDLLVQNPALLDAMDPPHAVDFFQAFRVGTPDKALNVFGTWAARQADLTCALAQERFFDRLTQTSLAGMAILTTQQLPAQATTLEQQFLQLPDGRCSLPVAYALSYSYLGRGKLNDWITSLDAKLADQTVTGDLRVNWLLARAQATEFTRPAPAQYPFGALYPSSWPLDGQTYLYQAVNAAQTPSVKVRAAKEIAARLTAAGDLQGATDFIGQVTTSLPDDQKAVVAAWQQTINGYVAGQAQATQAQQSLANKGYVQTLQARRAQAASQGNANAVSRYDALISAASSPQ
jgi:hypothetical protein